jgi:hypothetical protein
LTYARVELIMLFLLLNRFHNTICVSLNTANLLNFATWLQTLISKATLGAARPNLQLRSNCLRAIDSTKAFFLQRPSYFRDACSERGSLAAFFCSSAFSHYDVMSKQEIRPFVHYSSLLHHDFLNGILERPSRKGAPLPRLNHVPLLALFSLSYEIAGGT